MSESPQPLFSRPFLAALMVIIPLLVLLLNLSAAKVAYPVPSITTWQTSSGISVTWLTQDDWQSGQALELRLLFDQGYTHDSTQHLTDSTFALLLKDTLPLRTTGINQRFQPLGAKASYRLDADSSELAITLNSHPDLLAPSLALLTEWLPNPHFKERTFAKWQQSIRQDKDFTQQLLTSLYPQPPTDLAPNSQAIRLNDIQQHYQALSQQLRAITIAGPLTDVEGFKQTLDRLTQSFSASRQQADFAFTMNPALQTNEGDTLRDSYAAIALAPVSTPAAWLSLQLWQKQFGAYLNADNNANHLQLTLELTPQRQWLWWRIKHAPQILLSDQAQQTPQDHYYSRPLMTNFTLQAELFEPLFEKFTQQLAIASHTPAWWADIASQVTHGDTPALQQWVNTYSDALNSFTLATYKTHINALLQPQSIQEVQIRQ